MDSEPVPIETAEGPAVAPEWVAGRKGRLLVVDDDRFICKYIEDVATKEGFEVRSVLDAERFGEVHDSFDPGVVLLDLMLPRVDGVDLLHAIGRQSREVAIVLMSGLDARNLEAAERVGLDSGLQMCGLLEKPFTPGALRTILRRVVVNQIDEAELRRGLEAHEVVPHFQPKIDLATGRVVGAEALARWKHPEHGSLSPRQFIPLAEHCSLIGPLTNDLARVALAQLHEWRKSGHPDLHLAINLSARDLRRIESPDRWANLLSEFRIPPSALILEVTESEAMWTTVTSTEVLTRMRLEGLQLSIDDFGTGFSSLVLLHRLPFSEIKIDRSFICEVLSNRDAFVIVRSIIELGHALGLKVTAEGIEDADTAAALRDLGCDMAQGYHFAHPLPADEFTRWLLERSELDAVR